MRKEKSTISQGETALLRSEVNGQTAAICNSISNNRLLLPKFAEEHLWTQNVAAPHWVSLLSAKNWKGGWLWCNCLKIFFLAHFGSLLWGDTTKHTRYSNENVACLITWNHKTLWIEKQYLGFGSFYTHRLPSRIHWIKFKLVHTDEWCSLP